MESIFVLHDVTYEYPKDSRPVLSGITLTVKSGERIAVIGANASGKSTLVKMMNGLLLPQQGSVLVGGMNTQDKKQIREIRKTVGMVFQNPDNQMIAGTIEEEVAFGLQNYGVSRIEMQLRVRSALEYVGMWDARSRPPEQLSGGQKQRVAIASVLALKPRCIIFDEATSMLDSLGRKSVLDLQDQLNAEGTTVISVTHDMAEAARASRILILNQGNIEVDGNPEHVFTSNLSPYQLARPLPAEVSAVISERIPGFSHPLLSVEALFSEWDKWHGRSIHG